ncbi:MAG TPA: VCBS repeat-containing protein, partial [Rhodothermales bacterium]
MKRLALLMVAVWVPVTAGAQPFVSTTAPAVGPTIFGSVSLADFDGDGAMDILVTGSESGQIDPVARVYRNNGRVPDGTWSLTDVQATFPDVARYLAGLRASSSDVGDFDNDGDLDVLISGAGGTAVYRNEGSYRFTSIRLHDELISEKESYFVDIVTAPSSAWGDYDNDGDLDVLLTSRSGSYIYRNDGFARFTQVDVGLPPLPNGIVSWGDYDN